MIGVVGGLGPAATRFYYELLNGICLDRFGFRPEMIIYSLRLEEMCEYAKGKDRQAMARLVTKALRGLAAAGAEVAIVAANTPHAAWNLFARETGIPELVSIVEALRSRLEELEIRNVGLLAARTTVEAEVYKAIEGSGFRLITIPLNLQEDLDEVVLKELVNGKLGRRGREVLRRAAVSLEGAGAEAIAITCTDISPTLKLIEGAVNIPVLDASRIHVEETLRRAGCPL